MEKMHFLLDTACAYDNGKPTPTDHAEELAKALEAALFYLEEQGVVSIRAMEVLTNYREATK